MQQSKTTAMSRNFFVKTQSIFSLYFISTHCSKYFIINILRVFLFHFAVVLACCKAIVLCCLRLIKNQQTEELDCKSNPARCVVFYRVLAIK
jgi:hypothetical protein